MTPDGMTPADFLAMLDAATPAELESIAERLAPPVLNFPLARLSQPVAPSASAVRVSDDFRLLNWSKVTSAIRSCGGIASLGIADEKEHR